MSTVPQHLLQNAIQALLETQDPANETLVDELSQYVTIEKSYDFIMCDGKTHTFQMHDNFKIRSYFDFKQEAKSKLSDITGHPKPFIQLYENPNESHEFFVILDIPKHETTWKTYTVSSTVHSCFSVPANVSIDDVVVGHDGTVAQDDHFFPVINHFNDIEAVDDTINLNIDICVNEPVECEWRNDDDCDEMLEHLDDKSMAMYEDWDFREYVGKQYD